MEYYDNMTVDEYSTESGRMFKTEPAINVISKKDFEERISKVFHLLWETLSRSFGPYGAPTIIYNFPYSHVTKDGYTIMKNLSLNAAETKVDQAIANMAGDICGRLNFAVGDGTTTAIIATNSIYQQYKTMNNCTNSDIGYFSEHYILPRDIIKNYVSIKNEIIKRLKEKVIPIQTSDLDELYDKIYKVVFISSNGDETISKYIAELYRDIGAPAISCVLSPDGITRKKLIDGYKFGLVLNDRLYVNNDNNTCRVNQADVIIFGKKITEDTYKKILKPLNRECESRDRRLIVCAPLYDEKALSQTIAIDLNKEHDKTGKINMILTTYRNISQQAKRYANDFAILTNTTIIDGEMEDEIINKLNAGYHIARIFNIDSRNIENTQCIALDKVKADGTGISYTHGVDTLPDQYVPMNEFPNMDLIPESINLGYVGTGSIGLKATDSNFSGFHYNEEKYKKALEDAEFVLDEVIKKYKSLGTFNTEVSDAQERYYALKMKMGIIEVGGGSDLSTALNKDAVDDAVRASASAFKYGVVKGCNVNLIQVIKSMYDEETDEVKKVLINILLKGFKDVYRTVLLNAFPPSDITETPFKLHEVANKFFEKMKRNDVKIFSDDVVYNMYKDVIDKCKTTGVQLPLEKINIHDFIIDYSIETGKVFDVTTLQFTDEIMNSSQTDEEVLTATIDLISLLIVGNQMVVTGKHNF